MKSEKTASCNSRGIVISYGDRNKHQFVNYDFKNNHVQKIQISGKTNYQFKKPIKDFTPLQEELYSKVVYGFNAFTSKELSTMSSSKRFHVKLMYNKAHKLLNRWKQEIINEKINNFFLKLFPKSPVVKQLTSVNGYDDSLDVSCITFKDLGVSKSQIAEKLIEHNILPNNFFQLKP